MHRGFIPRGNAPHVSTLRAVIFDLDGTLADSLADIGGAMNEALAARGLKAHPLEAYKGFVGEGVEQLALRAAPAVTDQEALVAEYRARYAQRIDQSTAPYPGVPEVLNALFARGMKVGVLSNKRDDFTVELVKRQFSQWKFHDVRGERKGVPRKPHPQAALEIAQVLGVAPGETAFVGDTAIDMKTAVAAGMKAVGVLWGFRDRVELLGAGAQVLASNGEELLAALG